MKIGIAADHGGFELKGAITAHLAHLGHEVVDYGAYQLNKDDDYPDFVIPLAQAVAQGELAKGIAVCGSGVGAAIAANKIKGARASLVADHFSAHQGVEDDDMNILCLGGRITGSSLALELAETFIHAAFSGKERHLRRLHKVMSLEESTTLPPPDPATSK